MSEILFLKDRDLLDKTPVDNIFITRFMPDAPELAVKAYLYGLMQTSCPGSGEEDICAALGCSETDLFAAFSYWEHAGLIEVIPGESLRIRYFNVKNAMTSGRADTSGTAYGDFIRRLQETLGTRMLTGSELSKIYDWLDVFGFEQAAALEIVRYCLDEKGAKTNVSYMDSVAKTLAGKGEFTLEQVRAHFEYEKKLKSGAVAIQRRWNKKGMPTEDEIALYEKWTVAWGFDEEAIFLACERMTAAERPTFAYLDGVLKRWHEDGAVDREKIDDLNKQEDMIAELARTALKRAGLKTSPDSEKRAAFREWVTEWNMSAELILLAADHAKEDAKPFRAMKGIVNAWHEAGISSPAAAEEHFKKNRASYSYSGKKSANRALNYMTHGIYTEEKLKELGISLGEEFYVDDE
ncbi:MAG: DnaD domain protein [Clostridiales bacterium]|nr:DnaD domain protein [Clostridiales bacterium]